MNKIYGSDGSQVHAVKVTKGFDPTNLHAVDYSDGYLLKRHTFEGKGVKIFQKFRPMGVFGEREFLFVATFTQRQPMPSSAFEMGFTSETKAADLHYQLELYQCPKSPSEFNLLSQEPAIEKFNEN